MYDINNIISTLHQIVYAKRASQCQSGLILGLHPANERRLNKSMSSLTGCVKPRISPANASPSCDALIPGYKWGLWCQKQVSQAGINNCIPQYSLGCNYSSMPEIPPSGTKVLKCFTRWKSLANHITHEQIIAIHGKPHNIIDIIPSKTAIAQSFMTL